MSQEPFIVLTVENLIIPIFSLPLCLLVTRFCLLWPFMLLTSITLILAPVSSSTLVGRPSIVSVIVADSSFIRPSSSTEYILRGRHSASFW